jgi:hypothetical protein
VLVLVTSTTTNVALSGAVTVVPEPGSLFLACLAAAELTVPSLLTLA